MAFGVQPAGVAERRLLHPQRGGPGVHLLHECRLTAAHQLGHGHGRVVGRGNADGLYHLVQCKVLPRLQPDLTAAHVVGVLTHRHRRLHGQPPVVDSLEGKQQGHHLGDGGDGDPLVGVLLVEDPSAPLLNEDGSAAVEVELRRGSCGRQQNSFCPFLDVGADGPLFRVHDSPQAHTLCRPKGQCKQPEAEHGCAEHRKILSFHPLSLPAMSV